MMAQKNKNAAKKYAEDWLPIKSIVNGAIQLEKRLKCDWGKKFSLKIYLF